MPTFAAGYASTSTILDEAVTSAKIADGAIVNADINTSAAIAYSKLAALTSANLLIGNASNVATVTAVTGDITISNSGVTAIGTSKVTEAMQLLADNTTNNVSTSAHGYVPKATGSTTNFLRADGTYAAPSATSDIKKMHSARGSTTSSTEVEILTKTFAANDFAVTDTMMYVLQINKSEAANNCSIKLRVADGTNTFTSAQLDALEHIFLNCFFLQNAEATTNLIVESHGVVGTTASWSTAQKAGWEEATMIANWLSSAFTISIRGLANAAGTMYVDWKVYKLTA